MNECVHFQSDPEQQLLERLIDEDLSVAEQQALLRSLDDRPDGWRRCALALIEAQTLRRELGLLRSEFPAPINGNSVALPSRHGNSSGQQIRAPGLATTLSRRPGGSLSGWITIAAAVLVAFGLGIAARQWAPLVYEKSPGSLLADRDSLAAPHGQGPTAPIEKQGPLATLATNDAMTPSVMLSVLGENGTKQQDIEIPLVEADRLNAEWLEEGPQAVPPAVVEALRRAGHTVCQQRYYVPVILQDGRSAIVPIDEASVRPRGPTL